MGLTRSKGVSDNASNIRNVFKIHNIPHTGCFAHTIILSVGKALEDTSVKNVLGKTRSLVPTFKTSYLKTEDLHKNEKLKDLHDVQLIQDVATRWNSVYYMIERLLDVYRGVYANLYGTPHKHLLLNDEESKTLEYIKEILRPFDKNCFLRKRAQGWPYSTIPSNVFKSTGRGRR